MKSIKLTQPEDRPREKLEQRGAAALTDIELIAAILGSGIKGCDVMQLAHKVVAVFDSSGGAGFPAEQLKSISGIGAAKLTVLSAAWEFVGRRIRGGNCRISCPVDIMQFVRHYADRKQEHLLCITLNGANEVLHCRVVTIGLADRSLIHPREVYSEALTDRAAAIILAHNHPSGQLIPSDEDRKVTARLIQAGELLGVPLLDHLIFTTKGFYSFKEHGYI